MRNERDRGGDRNTEQNDWRAERTTLARRGEDQFSVDASKRLDMRNDRELISKLGSSSLTNLLLKEGKHFLTFL